MHELSELELVDVFSGELLGISPFARWMAAVAATDAARLGLCLLAFIHAPAD